MLCITELEAVVLKLSKLLKMLETLVNVGNDLLTFDTDRKLREFESFCALSAW